MIVQQGIGEKDGNLCFVEIEKVTGKYHYYPIRTKLVIFMAPDNRMHSYDSYLYVDREHEL